MTARPSVDNDAQRSSASHRRARRWRRIRARARLWRLRMHSHPVLMWTWRIAVALVGGLLVLSGMIMWFMPGPGWASVILGLVVLASEFGWARALLSRARSYLQKLNTAARNRRKRSRKAREAEWAEEQNADTE